MKKLLIIGIGVILLFSACRTDGIQKADYWPTSGWHQAEPGSLGFDDGLLEQMDTYLKEKNVTNLLIVRNRYKVYHYYTVREGFISADYSLLVPAGSITTSIVATLIGIAVEQGHIEDVEQSVADYFPEWAQLAPDERRDAMTLRHLLDMTTGWNWWDYSAQDYDLLAESENWVEFILDLEMSHQPGTIFNHNACATHLLSVIITRATGMDTYSFARENLFDPIGIGDVLWGQDPQGYYYGFYGLWMSTEDMARFGQLYLEEGKWAGKQFVPADWVHQSTSPQSLGVGGDKYGFHWWVSSLMVDLESVPTYETGGRQNIFVVPEYDLVVVAGCEDYSVLRACMQLFILKPLLKGS